VRGVKLEIDRLIAKIVAISIELNEIRNARRKCDLTGKTIRIIKMYEICKIYFPLARKRLWTE